MESAETRKFRFQRPNLKLFCRNLYFGFVSSAAFGRGCTADKCVAAFIGGEMIAGEILFFFRGIANNCVLRKFRIEKKLTLIKSQSQNVVTFGFIVQDTEEKIQISFFQCHQTKALLFSVQISVMSDCHAVSLWAQLDIFYCDSIYQMQIIIKV